MKIIQINPKKTKVRNFLVFIPSIFSFLFLPILSGMLGSAGIVFHFAPIAHGQSPSPEPSPTETEELDEKIQDIREAVKEKVQEKLANVKKGQKRAFVGEIDEITNSTLKLTTREGKKQTRVDKETKIIDQNRKEIEIEDLEINDYVIAMGYLEETDVLAASRIVVADKPKPIDRELALGKVTDISEEEVLTIKNERKGITYTIETTSKTIVTKKVEGEIEKLRFSEIELDDFLVVIGTLSENEEKIITAKLIHVVASQKPKITTEETEDKTEESKEATSSPTTEPEEAEE